MQQNVVCKAGRCFRNLIILTILLCVSVAGSADPQVQAKDKNGLTISLGYVSTSGNSATTTGNFKGDYHGNWGRLHYAVYGSYLFTDVTNQETGIKTRDTERIEAGVKTEYSIGKSRNFFTNVSWKKDEPSGIAHNLSLASGYGLAFFESEKSGLKGGVGLEGFQEEKIADGNRFSNSVLAIYFQVGYHYNFNKNNFLKFSNESRMSLSDNSDYRLSNNFSYVSAINHTLALEVSYQHNYKNLPVDDKRKTDTITTVNLVFHF